MSESMKIALPVGALALAAGAYFTGNLPETFAGLAIVTLAVLLPSPLAARTLVPLAPRGAARSALLGAAVVAVSVSAVPLINALFPGEPAFSGSVSETQKTLRWASASPGHYLMMVDGALVDRQGEVTAPYRLKVGNDTFDGVLWRRLDQVRVGRRGSAVAEHQRTFERHHVQVPSGDVDITLARSTNEISGPLKLSLFRVWLPLWLFVAIGLMAFAVAAFYEAKYANEKNRSVLTSAIAFTLFFAFMFPDQMSSASIVKPAAGSVIASGLVGLTAGGITSWLLRKFRFGATSATMAR